MDPNWIQYKHTAVGSHEFVSSNNAFILMAAMLKQTTISRRVQYVNND